MQYMLLIYGTESERKNVTPADTQRVFAAYKEFDEALRNSGAHLAGDALRGIETATTVRVRDNDASVTDGPFAETTEQLGGYYLIDVDNLDEALEWTKKCPGSWHGSIEVRPVWDLSGVANDA